MLAIVVLGLACGGSAAPPASGGDAGAVPSLGALAGTDGCASATDCRSAPLGTRACGGPRDYLVYCARTTDTVAPFRALAALASAERAANANSGAISTCELRLPPVPALVGGRCAAGAARVRTGANRPQ